jgi:hypothetical protein
MTNGERSEESRGFPYKPGNPWLGVDRREEYEEFIAGNRAGLEALRDAIEAALNDGQAQIDIPFSDYPGVVVVESDPLEIEREKPTAMDWIAATVSFLLVPGLVIGGAVVAVILIKWLWALVFAQ